MTPERIGRPTLYRGTRMRSRLEAACAARLDGLGIEWTYEPVCFADQSGQYLPDFQLRPSAPPSGVSIYLEVKPSGLCRGAAWETFTGRMEIIWSSVPLAILVLWLPDVRAAFIALPDDHAWYETDEEIFDALVAL